MKKKDLLAILGCLLIIINVFAITFFNHGEEVEEMGGLSHNYSQDLTNLEFRTGEVASWIIRWERYPSKFRINREICREVSCGGLDICYECKEKK